MEQTKQRGRPTLGDTPMNAAERMRRSYQRKKKAGLVDVRVRITEAQRKSLPVIAAAAGYDRLGEFLTALVSEGLERSADEHWDQIDRALTAKVMGMKKETIRKVLRGEITKLIEENETDGWKSVCE